MNKPDSVVVHELPIIQQVIANETWYEGERRHCPVDPHDPIVQEHVCAIVLAHGAEWRARCAIDLQS